MPCAVFSCEGAPYGKSTRCPPGGTPVLESTSTVPPRSSVELFYVQPVQGRLPKIPIGRIQPLEIVWNGAIDSERPPKMSLHSNQSSRLIEVNTHPQRCPHSTPPLSLPVPAFASARIHAVVGFGIHSYSSSTFNDFFFLALYT